MIRTLNHPVTFLIVLGLFCWLAVCSWRHAHPVAMSEGEFVEMKLAEYHPPDRGVVQASHHD
ncbi:hypothetical protein [Zavarzinella formosa]|uniref:hypothetical protein n=1 Tax=Zavarzinella formosa TaxID=360055 RepID=UPI0002F956BA|nr:hypothetical protein [Zavarzinella formosa]